MRGWCHSVLPRVFYHMLCLHDGDRRYGSYGGSRGRRRTSSFYKKKASMTREVKVTSHRFLEDVVDFVDMKM
jgi:hypothetical protein